MDKIKVGDSFEHKVRFTQDNVNTFAKITGDCNPIHVDAQYAAKTPFGRCIVHGFYAGSVFSKVFGMLWPGEGTIYMYQEMAFRAPVFVDKDYTAHFEAVEVNEEKHRGVIKCLLIDPEGKEVIIGQAKLQNTARF